MQRSGKLSARNHWEEYWLNILNKKGKTMAKPTLREALKLMGAVLTVPAMQKCDAVERELNSLREDNERLRKEGNLAEKADTLVKNLTQP